MIWSIIQRPNSSVVKAPQSAACYWMTVLSTGNKHLTKPAILPICARREGLRDFGAAMSPQNAFAILQGTETLALKMEKHVAKTRAVVDFLVQQDALDSVTYPELSSHPEYALAKRLLPQGCGAVFSFNLEGDRAAGRRMVELLEIFSHSVWILQTCYFTRQGFSILAVDLPRYGAVAKARH